MIADQEALDRMEDEDQYCPECGGSWQECDCEPCCSFCEDSGIVNGSDIADEYDFGWIDEGLWYTCPRCTGVARPLPRATERGDTGSEGATSTTEYVDRHILPNLPEPSDGIPAALRWLWQMEAETRVRLDFHSALQAFHRRIEGFYARAHDGRLPGSTRTRRLRKKRRAMVLQWWREKAP